MKEYLKQYTLAQVEQAFNRGLITMDDMYEYIDEWNGTPGRFTVAYWQSGAIRQKRPFSYLRLVFPAEKK